MIQLKDNKSYFKSDLIMYQFFSAFPRSSIIIIYFFHDSNKSSL